MCVTATITREDGTQITLTKPGFAELAAWMEEHYGEFVRIEAKRVGNRDLRQGRCV